MIRQLMRAFFLISSGITSSVAQRYCHTMPPPARPPSMKPTARRPPEVRTRLENSLRRLSLSESEITQAAEHLLKHNVALQPGKRLSADSAFFDFRARPPLSWNISPVRADAGRIRCRPPPPAVAAHHEAGDDPDKHSKRGEAFPPGRASASDFCVPPCRLRPCSRPGPPRSSPISKPSPGISRRMV